MSQSLLSAAAAGLLLLSLALTFRSGSALKSTALKTAWKWGLAAEFAWFTTAASTAIAAFPPPLLDQFWYWSAVVGICPLIAVLGARWPTSRVWNWFIIVPLIAVLGWPAATVLWTSATIPPLKVQAPVYLGFLLVLIMGLGNFAGTRFGRPAAIAGLGLSAVLVPASSLIAITPGRANLIRGAAAVLMALATLDALWLARRPGTEKSPYDQLWFDFRDLFGIVWAIRIQERINEIAGREDWASRLGTDGFEWDSKSTAEQRERTLERMDHALRWHLRRFVNPEWINRRLAQRPETANDQMSPRSL
jgi:hypothetical protein